LPLAQEREAVDDGFDVVIVGGGVMGSSVAYHLKTLDARISVLVLERDPNYRTASSALSLSSIRQQFSSPVNMALSRDGFRFLRDAPRLLEVDGDAPHIGLVERGYLYLATPGGADGLRALNAVQRAHGADIALLAPDALAQRYPWLNTDGIALGSLGLRGEGWFDGYGLLQALRRKARALGVAYRKAEATSLRREGARVAGVGCADGSFIGCGALVNAAGPHAAAVARMAGFALPVVPERHCVFVFECRDPIPDCPLVIDPSGIYFRPEGRGFLAGAPPRDADAPENRTLEVDHALFDDVLWPALAARVPAFEAIRQTAAWAGFYEMNSFDHNAIIGRAPELTNMLLINGFSGHGIQQAPAAGLALAELIVHGGYRTLDVGALGYERIPANRPLRELNVI
jgi:glycine/D-amino acid oxidase-like deaminating enzyme